MKTIVTILIMMISFVCYGQMPYNIGTIANDKDTALRINEDMKYLELNKLDIQVASKTYVGFTALGSGNVRIKMKIITGTSGRMNSSTGAAHGLTGEKIIGFTAKIHQLTNQGVLPGYGYSAGYNYECFYNSTDFVIQLSSTNSASIQGKPFTIMVWYIE